MNEFEQLVGEIQALLAQEGDPAEETLTRLYQHYIEAVGKCNARLQKCDELLRHGHRGEAIHQCEIDPKLLDMVELLDFPEREAWFDFVRQFGRPAPPDLLIDVAGDLNAAYSDEQPIARLMRRHRHLVLAGSPLQDRITVMRQIRRIDGENPIWEEDIRTFEKARHEQILPEAEVAAKRADVNALALLAREATSSAWLEAPPAAVINRTKAIYTHVCRNQAKDEMARIADQLNEAHSKLDVPQAKNLRDRWNEFGEIARLAEGDELSEMVAPALDWLSAEESEETAQQQYEALKADIEYMLNEGAKREDMEPVYYALVRTERGVPEVLEERYHERLRILEDAHSRRNRLLVVSVVSVVLFIGVLTAFAILHVTNTRKFSANVSNLDQMLSNKDFDGVRGRLADIEKNEPKWMETAEIKRIASQLKKAAADENARKSAFREQIAAITECLEQPTWLSISRGEALIAETRDLAEKDEQEVLARLARQLADERRKLQETEDQEYSSDLEAFIAEVDKMPEKYDLEKLRRLHEKGTDLKERPNVSPVLKAPLEPLLAKLLAYRRTKLANNKELGLLDNITAAVGEVNRYVRAIEGYVKTDGSRPGRADSFQRVLNERKLWSDVESWNKLLARAKEIDPTKVSPTDAKRFVDDYEALLKASPSVPAAANLASLKQTLQVAIQRADEAGGASLTALDDLLVNLLFVDTYMVKTRDGRVFYSKDAPKNRKEGWTFRILIDATDLSKVGDNEIHIKDAEVINPLVDGNINFTSPQTAFRNFAMKERPKLRGTNWEKPILAMTEKLIEDREMDPIIKLLALQTVLETGASGSYFLQEAFENQLVTLKDADVMGWADTNFLDPDDADGNNARAKAEVNLSVLHDGLKVAVDQAREWLASAASRDYGAPLQWIGWLHKDMEDKWTCSLRRDLEESAAVELMVIHPGSEDAEPPAKGDDPPIPAVVTPIGRLKNGEPLIKQTGPGLLEGRPVYTSNQDQRPHTE